MIEMAANFQQVDVGAPNLGGRVHEQKPTRGSERLCGQASIALDQFATLRPSLWSPLLRGNPRLLMVIRQT